MFLEYIVVSYILFIFIFIPENSSYDLETITISCKSLYNPESIRYAYFVLIMFPVLTLWYTGLMYLYKKLHTLSCTRPFIKKQKRPLVVYKYFFSIQLKSVFNALK